MSAAASCQKTRCYRGTTSTRVAILAVHVCPHVHVAAPIVCVCVDGCVDGCRTACRLPRHRPRGYLRKRDSIIPAMPTFHAIPAPLSSTLCTSRVWVAARDCRSPRARGGSSMTTLTFSQPNSQPTSRWHPSCITADRVAPRGMLVAVRYILLC